MHDMKLPLSIASKLMKLQQGATIPAAQLKHPVVDKLLEDGVLQKQRTGSNRNLYFINSPAALKDYLYNHFGIPDLNTYISGYSGENLTRSEAVQIASNSKLRAVRTFKGFLVNTVAPISTTLNGKPFIIHPLPGTFRFIYDFEQFMPAPDVCIVGIENPENFRWLEKQVHLFGDTKYLVVSRYPQTQTGDVIRWLKGIPNKYLHFGDFDFEGINIYLREYKKYLHERASFFIPPSVEGLIDAHGNRDLYNAQWHHQPAIATIEEDGILSLLALLHKHKKVLEQEALIGR